MDEQFEFAAKPRSSFITVLAWIFIVLAGLTTFISILQNIMITAMFPVEEMNRSFSDPDFQENVPTVFSYVFSNIRVFFFGFFAISCATFISAIGLLKRRNWARIVFIIIMAAGIAWNIFALILQQIMIPEMAEMPGQIGNGFETMMTIMRVFFFVMALGVSVLFGWIIKRLVSLKIRQEFMPEIRQGASMTG